MSDGTTRRDRRDTTGRAVPPPGCWGWEPRRRARWRPVRSSAAPARPRRRRRVAATPRRSRCPSRRRARPSRARCCTASRPTNGYRPVVVGPGEPSLLRTDLAGGLDARARPAPRGRRVRPVHRHAHHRRAVAGAGRVPRSAQRPGQPAAQLRPVLLRVPRAGDAVGTRRRGDGAGGQQRRRRAGLRATARLHGLHGRQLRQHPVQRDPLAHRPDGRPQDPSVPTPATTPSGKASAATTTSTPRTGTRTARPTAAQPTGRTRCGASRTSPGCSTSAARRSARRA